LLPTDSSKIFRVVAIDKPKLGLAEGARRFWQMMQKGVEQMLTGLTLSALAGYAFRIIQGQSPDFCM
jgi:hypothetical protein